MPKFALNGEALPVILELRRSSGDEVELVASGGPNQDEQILLTITEAGAIRREVVNAAAANNMGFQLENNRIFDLFVNGYGRGPIDEFELMDRDGLIGYLEKTGGVGDWQNGYRGNDDDMRQVCRARKQQLAPQIKSL